MDDQKYIVELRLTREEVRVLKRAITNLGYHNMKVARTLDEPEGVESIRKEIGACQRLYVHVTQQFTRAFGQNRKEVF